MGSPRETRLDMNLPDMPEVGLWFGPRVLDLLMLGFADPSRPFEAVAGECRACAAPQPAALVMSGHAGRADIAQLHDEGALHFFPKPVVLPALMKALEEVAATRPATAPQTPPS